MTRTDTFQRQAAATKVEGSLRRLVPYGLGLLALGLGLTRLSGRGFTFDEHVTILTVGRSVSGIWHSARATEAPHFVYYLLMKPWLGWVGSSAWDARIPSVVCGALATVLVASAGTRLYGARAGLASGAALATNPYVLHWWQSARAYSPALLFAVLSVYAFVRSVESSRTRWRAAWAAAAVVAAWLNLFTVSVLVAIAGALVTLRQRLSVRGQLLVFAAALAAIVPIIILVAAADNGQLSWIPEPSLRRVVVQIWDWAGRNPGVLFAAFLGLVALAAGRVPGTARWKTALVCGLLVTPFVLTLGLSLIQPAFDAHYLLFAAPGLALLVGAAFAALPARPALLLALVVAAGAGLQLAHYYIAPGKPLSSLF
jgi:mannosyltransferase